MENQIKAARQHYEQIDVDTDRMRNRLFERLESMTIDTRHDLKISKTNYKSKLVKPAVPLLIGVAVYGFAGHTTTTTPHTLSTQSINQDLKHVPSIDNQFGTFVRIEKPLRDIPKSEISDEAHVTKFTKEIITPYGVFLKNEKPNP
jgi:hypothetical protein